MIRCAVTSLLPCGAGGESIRVRERARDFGKGTGALSIRRFRGRTSSSSLVFGGVKFLLLRMPLQMLLQDKRQTRGAQQGHVRNKHMYFPTLELRSRVIVFAGDIYAVRMYSENHVEG